MFSILFVLISRTPLFFLKAISFIFFLIAYFFKTSQLEVTKKNINHCFGDDKKLIDDLSKKVIKDFTSEYEKLSALSREALEPIIKSLIDKHKTNFKGVGQPIRIALVGSRFGPGIYDVILSLDKSEVIKRLNKFK